MSLSPSSHGDAAKPQVSNTRWVVLTVGAFVGVTAVMGGLFWAMGLSNFSGTDSAAKVLVAVLALVGTLFGTIVTLVGLMLKRSIDARTLVLQIEAEARLNLDTAIKAVELFKSASGSASSAESAGALFALTRLGQPHFALALLEELWPKDLIQTPSAIWVLNNALRSKEADVALIAVGVLESNVARLPDGQGGKNWPDDYAFEWRSEMPFLARGGMLSARVECLLSKPFDYWVRGTLNADIAFLSSCFRTESSPIIRQSAAAFLAILLQIYDPREKNVVYLSTGELDIETVRGEIEKTYGSFFSPGTQQDEELKRKLGTWIKRSPYFDIPRPTAEGSSGE